MRLAWVQSTAGDLTAAAGLVERPPFHWMLGRFITAFGTEVTDYLFTLGIMATVPAVYTLLAACWLIAKTEEVSCSKKHAYGQIRRGGR